MGFLQEIELVQDKLLFGVLVVFAEEEYVLTQIF